MAEQNNYLGNTGGVLSFEDWKKQNGLDPRDDRYGIRQQYEGYTKTQNQYLSDTFKANLAADVKSGKLTQEQADTLAGYFPGFGPPDASTKYSDQWFLDKFLEESDKSNLENTKRYDEGKKNIEDDLARQTATMDQVMKAAEARVQSITDMYAGVSEGLDNYGQTQLTNAEIRHGQQAGQITGSLMDRGLYNTTVNEQYQNQENTRYGNEVGAINESVSATKAQFGQQEAQAVGAAQADVINTMFATNQMQSLGVDRLNQWIYNLDDQAPNLQDMANFVLQQNLANNDQGAGTAIFAQLAPIAGAIVGSAVAPGVGTAAGAAVGGAVGNQMQTNTYGTGYRNQY